MDRARATAQRLLDHTFAHNPLGLALVTLDGWFVKVNQAMCDLVGLPEAELLSEPYGLRTREEELEVELPLIGELLDGRRDSFTVEKRVIRPDGSAVWCEMITSVVEDPDGGDRLLFGQLRDVSEQRRLESELAHRGLHDPLTGLANRALFHERVEAELAADGAGAAALIFIDIDDFKMVNDALGHATGDELLRKVAGRLTQSCRDADVVARLGGDEFGVLLTSIDDHDSAAVRCATFQSVIEEPMYIGDQRLQVTASAGLRVLETDARRSLTVDELLADADLAMYEAKSGGKARSLEFDPALRHEATARLAIGEGVRSGLLANQLELHYQPMVHLVDGRPLGLEALARWRHPELAVLPPSTFLATVLEMGAAAELCRAVLAKLLDDRRHWAVTDHPAQHLGVSINLSADELLDPTLHSMIQAALGDQALPERGFYVELSSEGLVSDPEGATRSLHRLRELGVGIVLDDFGSGYSSLSFLQRMPIDVVKLGQDILAPESEDPSFLGSVVEMCHGMGLHIVAEGIETEDQARRLMACGVGRGQGHHFTPPLDPDALRHYLEGFHTDGGPGAVGDDTAGRRASDQETTAAEAQPAAPLQAAPGSGVVGPSM